MRALALARRGLNTVTPNPMVGAVLVKNGRVIGEGWHVRKGGDHAEIRALKNAGDSARGSTLYCTLEPCCVQGDTPPCTTALIRAGIRTVVLAMKDPNPSVSGRGIRILRAAGIEVSQGCLEDRARELNRPFIHFMQTRTPYVYLKWAATLDGCIAEPGGRSQWITGEIARTHGRKLRNRVDAVLVGSKTILNDNPLLDRIGARQPTRPLRKVILDPGLETPTDSRIFSHSPGTVILIHSASAARVRSFNGTGAILVRIRSGSKGFSLRTVLAELTSFQITSLLVEGGGTTTGSFIGQGFFNEGFAFYSPSVMGKGIRVAEGIRYGLDDLPRVTVLNTKKLENDIMLHWVR